MTLTSVVRTQFSVDLAVEGIAGRFEVASFEAHFSLNEIPMASCALAIGREASDGLGIAKVHAHIADFKIMKKATVYFTPYGEWDEGVPWPAGEKMIFEGRVTGTGFQKADGNIQFVVSLIHWLSDLDFASCLTTRSHPTNPAQYTFPAIVEPLVGTQGFTATGRPVAGGIAQTAEAESLADPDNIQEDLWGKAIKPLFCALAKEENVVFSMELIENCLDEFENTDVVLDALKRIESVGKGESSDSPDCDLERSCYTPPLALLLGDSGSPESVAESIGEALMRDTIESYNHQTMWGKLVGQFSSSFGFAVVPQVTKCLVIPFVAGLRETYCKIIEATDYVSINISGTLSRPLKAIVIHGAVGSNTGLGANAGNPMQDAGISAGIVGCFAPKDVKTGMILFENAPMWLANVPSGGHSTARSTGLASSAGTGSATTPADDSDDLIANKEGKTQEEIYKGETAMYNGWAHAAYVGRQLAGRTGNLFGKLRFDIAPGSNIIIEGSSEKFITGDRTAEQIYATVARVSYRLNAEQGSAGTGFSFAHARTGAENENDKTSVEKHPLYETSFPGAPLIDAYQFKNEKCCT
jgi:hypothetical protein